jgi:putative ubiquitin-RnfH superfamily antitoxin RatB of RatAB toxin-antitoxin module
MITVEVVFAQPDSQWLESVSLPEGSTLRSAIDASCILDRAGAGERQDLSFGIWGQVASSERQLRDGDRVEIYRRLLIDPKDERRKLAGVGQTMRGEKSK